MKIFLLADGSSAHTKKWVLSLQTHGIELYLFSINTISKEILKESNEQLKIYSANLGAKVSASNLEKVSYFKLIPRLIREIRVFQPDIVHAHYISSYGLLALLSGFRPYVLSVWGSDIMVFPNRSFLHRIYIKFILKKAHQVFATSQLMLEVVQKDFGKKESMRLPFGIDTTRFKPAELPVKTDFFTFIILKNLAPTYGIDIAIKAFQQLKVKHPDRAMRLLIYGDGAKRAEYEALASDLLNQSIYFKGKIPTSQAPTALQQAQVMLNVSRSESFGVSVLEASSCGLAVIVSNRGGLPETVEPGKTGLMLQELSADGCAEAMETYLNNPEMLDQHANHGRAFVLANFRQEKLAEIQVEAYRKIIQEL